MMDKDFGRVETMMRSSCLRAASCWDGEENVDAKRRDLVQLENRCLARMCGIRRK